MGAAELMEWVAYYDLRNESTYNKIQDQIESERSDAERASILRSFLNVMGKVGGNKRNIKN